MFSLAKASHKNLGIDPFVSAGRGIEPIVFIGSNIEPTIGVILQNVVISCNVGKVRNPYTLLCKDFTATLVLTWCTVLYLRIVNKMTTFNETKNKTCFTYLRWAEYHVAIVSSRGPNQAVSQPHRHRTVRSRGRSTKALQVRDIRIDPRDWDGLNLAPIYSKQGGGSKEGVFRGALHPGSAGERYKESSKRFGRAKFSTNI